MLTLLNTPCSKNGPFIAIPVLAQEKTYFKSNDSYVTRILTRMPIAQRGRVMAPASDQLNARFLSSPKCLSLHACAPRYGSRSSCHWIRCNRYTSSIYFLSNRYSTRPETLMLNYATKCFTRGNKESGRSIDTCPQIFPLVDKYRHAFSFIIHSSRSKNKRPIETFDSFEPIEIYPKLSIYLMQIITYAIISIANRLFA